MRDVESRRSFMKMGSPPHIGTPAPFRHYWRRPTSAPKSHGARIPQQSSGRSSGRPRAPRLLFRAVERRSRPRKDSLGARRIPPAMPSIEVSRTLVKSPPELWAELEGDCLAEAIGDVRIEATEPERELAWRAPGASGTAKLEPSSWGTKVTLTAEVEEQVAEHGL